MVLIYKLIELPTYILVLLLYLNPYVPLKDFKSFFSSSIVDFSCIFVYVLKGLGYTDSLTFNLSSSVFSSDGCYVFVAKGATRTKGYTKANLCL